MHSIYVVTVINLILCTLLWGGLIYVFAGRERRYLALLGLGLPWPFLVNPLLVRPLILWAGEMAGMPLRMGRATPPQFILLIVLLPAVIEELVKVAPLLLLRARQSVQDLNTALWTGTALGVGFGLGETMFLAYGVAQDPWYTGQPWYAFLGFFVERLLTTGAHGALAAFVVAGWQQGRTWRWVGYLSAVGLHGFVNLGVILSEFDLIWAPLTGLMLLVSTGTVLYAFERLRRYAGRA